MCACVCVHMYIHASIINEKEAMNLKQSKRGIWEMLEAGKISGILGNYSLKNKRKNIYFEHDVLIFSIFKRKTFHQFLCNPKIFLQ